MGKVHLGNKLVINVVAWKYYLITSSYFDFRDIL